MKPKVLWPSVPEIFLRLDEEYCNLISVKSIYHYWHYEQIAKNSYRKLYFFAISRHSLDQLFIFEFVSSHINNIFIGQIWSRLTRKVKHHFKSQKGTNLIAKLTKNLLGSKCLLQNCKIMEVVRTKFSTVLKNSYKLGKKNCLNNLTSEKKIKKF